MGEVKVLDALWYGARNCGYVRTEDLECAVENTRLDDLASGVDFRHS